MVMAGPFILFILAFLVVGGVLIWRKGGKAGKWVLIVSGIFLVLLFMLHFSARRFSPERAYDETFYPSQRSVRPGWYANLAREYEADVYPSQEAALRALGRRMETPIQEIRQYQSSQGHPQKTSLTLVRNQIEPKYLDAFRAGIKERTGATIRYAADKSELQQGDVYLEFAIQEEKNERSPWNSGQRVSRGRISASAKTVGSNTTIQARYEEKPWVEDFDKFQAEDARGRNQRWIVGKSRSTVHNSGSAHREAIEDGMWQLQPLVESRLQKYLRRQGWFGTSRPNSKKVQEILRGELRSQVYVADRFEQKFQQNGRSIWWEVMLINASDRNLDLLVKRCVQGKGRQEWTWSQTAGSAAGLLGLVCVVYLFLNLATRGYYVWVLRGAVVVIILVIVILVGLLD